VNKQGCPSASFRASFLKRAAPVRHSLSCASFLPFSFCFLDGIRLLLFKPFGRLHVDLDGEACLFLTLCLNLPKTCSKTNNRGVGYLLLGSFGTFQALLSGPSFFQVWWRPPPFGEGGEEVNIRFEELRPAMTWNRGQWCFPGHPQGPLGVLVTRNRVGRPSNTDSKPEATGTTPVTVLGKRKPGKRELVSQTRYGRMVKPKSEAQEGAEGELETPRKPKTPTGVRDGILETAKKRKKERVPFRRGSVNESLSPEERMEVARKALQEDACNPDIGKLEEAVQTVLGCGLPSFMKKGVQFRHARFRLMLARCAETGRACPDQAHTDSVFARGPAAGHALGTEHPSPVKGVKPTPRKG
jgi:hypothetical protein